MFGSGKQWHVASLRDCAKDRRGHPWRPTNMSWAPTVSEVKVMHIPPNPFSARAKKIRRERSVKETDKGGERQQRQTGNNRMVVLGGFAYILLGSLAPYAIRTQERANEALGIGIRLYHVIFIIYEILIIIDNRIENEEYFSPHKCSAIFSYTCRAALICVGRICPWWCRGAEWWRWGGRSQWWRPGSASHLALCRWSSHSSEDYPPPQLLGQLSYRFHSQIRSVLYRYLENWRGQDRMNPNWAN